MKKILAVIISLFIVFSCAITKYSPSWIDISTNGVYVEYCKDTLTYDQLDSVLRVHDIKPSKEEVHMIKYYNIENDYQMSQFVYNKYAKRSNVIDTTFIINNFDDKYILTIRAFNKYE